jgi:hypothetical protein
MDFKKAITEFSLNDILAPSTVDHIGQGDSPGAGRSLWDRRGRPCFFITRVDPAASLFRVPESVLHDAV